MPKEILKIIEEDEDKVLLEPAPRLAHVINLGVDWERRVIHLTGEIEQNSGEWLWTVIQQLGNESKISLHLNTPGGDIDSMYAIHDSVRRHGNVEVLAYGQCCSAGVLILACAHRRLVTESLILMSHETTASQGELGYRAAKDRRKVDDWQHDYWAELMSRYTPKDQPWWKRKLERQAEYWLMGGHEIVEAGIADRVV